MKKRDQTAYPLPIQTGNAAKENVRGWFVGHFIKDELDLRHSEDVEMKWGAHKAGDARTEWVTGETRTTICVLWSGHTVVEFRDRTVVLKEPGDYVIWGPGTDHRWRVTEDSVALSIRWPSIAGFQ